VSASANWAAASNAPCQSACNVLVRNRSVT